VFVESNTTKTVAAGKGYQANIAGATVLKNNTFFLFVNKSHLLFKEYKI